MDFLRGNADLKFFKVLVDLAAKRIKCIENPFILRQKGIRQLVGNRLAVDVHTDKASRIPNLIGKVAAGLHTFIGKTRVVAGADAGNQRKAQSVRAILLNDLERIDAVAKRLAHFAALAVTHKSMEEDR